MSDDFSSLPGTLAALWTRLEAAVRDRSGPGRYLALATRGLKHGAEARMVVLRRADPERGTLVLHTHGLSHKVAELAADPCATLLLWDAEAGFQVRLRVTAEAEPGMEADWLRVPETGRRLNYGSLPPATPIADPEVVCDTPPDRSAFTRIVARIDQVETLHLGRDLVRRARFFREAGFRGRWIAP